MNAFGSMGTILVIMQLVFIVFLPIMLVIFVFSHKKMAESHERLSSAIEKIALEMRRKNNQKMEEEKE